MSVETVEHVLVVPTLLFHQLGHFQGFSPALERYLSVLLSPDYTSYRPRPEMEADPSFKQLIPYCIFTCQGQVFYYRRGGGQGEARLRKKRSIGVGGHISTVDGTVATTAYRAGMQRELEEEVEIGSTYHETCLGLINDDETEVGKVHLGVVHKFELILPKVSPREASMMESGFASPEVLQAERDDFETWSQICLDHLF